MTLLSHLVIFASYLTLALAVAFGLKDMAVTVDVWTAYLAGGIVFVLGAVLHEAFARRADADALADDMHELRIAGAESQSELSRIATRFAGMERDAAARPDNEEMLGELRVLRSLLNGLARKQVRRAIEPPPAEAGPANDPGHAGEFSGREILDITREALEENRVQLYLQPVVSLPQRKVRYYEAFSRIQCQDGRLIVPEQYLAIAARSGLVSTIDNILLFRCVQLVRKLRKQRRDVGFICNISQHTLDDQDFFEQFSEFMAANRDLARSLVFEFGQADLERRGGEVDALLERLTALGFVFSLDQGSRLDTDFRSLGERNFRYFKVGAEHLLGGVDKNRAAIDPADLAEALTRESINLVAEKVEHERIVPELLECNVDYAQGYLFGEPKPPRDQAA